MTFKCLAGCIAVAILAGSCIPPKEEITITEARTTVFDDPEYRKIYAFQDRLLTDSIYPFCRHTDPTYRRLAALAFASVRDSAALDSLLPLLQDPVPAVREAAAYAAGQLGLARAENALIAAFQPFDTLGAFTASNAAILEAIGKCGTTSSLRHLATITSYQNTDTALLLGQCRGIYRFALRKMTSEKATERMASLALNPTYPASARLIAAHYLARASNITIDTFASALASFAYQEPNTDIRMALAAAMGKIPSRPFVQDTLINWYTRETDYRVKINLLKSLAVLDYSKSKPILFLALRDMHPQVAIRAAQALVESGTPTDARAYWRASRDTLLLPRVKATLLAAAQRHFPKYAVKLRDTLNADIRNRFNFAQKPYNKAAYLQALAEYGWNYRFIFKAWQEATHPAVRSAAAEALSNISSRPDFSQHFGNASKQTEKALAEIFKTILVAGDPGPMAIAAGALRQPDRNYRTYLDTLNFLDTAEAALQLPRDYETLQEIRQTASFLRSGKIAPVPKPSFNHPIDWATLESLPKKPRAVIRTEKGDIVLALLPGTAPGTVANFVDLAKKGFFNDKNFHRVVPNFVIQGGCPRGDGYGSLDYTIRSELPPMYYDQEGWVGMASAGNHTEGVQFFITHSPTPHLDGNYTIFAKVVSGMRAVHDIQIGDQIQRVTIQ
jgi:cyclophilin family peptidyl-prolyl cis-trans isomerase/HEAT repeat protein